MKNYNIKETKLTSPNIHIIEADISHPEKPPQSIIISFSPSETAMLTYGQNIPKVRWWQFWRYHLIKQYNRRKKEIREDVIQLYENKKETKK